jgi:hypothetical protein
MACGSKETGTPPFPFPPPGERPGREGSPHAGSTLRASKQRWHASCCRLPPTRGAAAPLWIPRWFLRNGLDRVGPLMEALTVAGSWKQ